jgi:hypothetical protein
LRAGTWRSPLKPEQSCANPTALKKDAESQSDQGKAPVHKNETPSQPALHPQTFKPNRQTPNLNASSTRNERRESDSNKNKGRGEGSEKKGGRKVASEGLVGAIMFDLGLDLPMRRCIDSQMDFTPRAGLIILSKRNQN